MQERQRKRHLAAQVCDNIFLEAEVGDEVTERSSFHRLHHDPQLPLPKESLYAFGWRQSERTSAENTLCRLMLGCLLNAIIAISFSRAGMFVCLPISNLFKAILLPSERRSPIYTDPEEPSPAFLRLLIWFRGFSNLNWTASLEAALKSFALGGAGLVQPAERNSRMSSTICGFLIVSSLPIPEDFKICLHSSGNPLNPVESLGSTWTCVMCCKLYGREMPCSSCFLDKLRVI
mmetsp:Transcript_3098/g.10431  ORF Transcript_3098/g.10431 Transcript_3098/m.10431 type:complete len:233 (-) Transcript_3098:252-950(-)